MTDAQTKRVLMVADQCEIAVSGGVSEAAETKRVLMVADQCEGIGAFRYGTNSVNYAVS